MAPTMELRNESAGFGQGHDRSFSLSIGGGTADKRDNSWGNYGLADGAFLGCFTSRPEKEARDSHEQIERRLVLAQKELEDEKKCQFYAFSIENSQKESTIIALENMIVESIKSSI